MGYASGVAARSNPAPDLRFRLLGVAGVLVLTIASVTYALSGRARLADLVPLLVVATSFLLIGFFAWARRPDNRIGPLMTALGASFLLLFFGGGPWPVLEPINLLGFTLQGSLLAYLILAFPSGELRTSLNRGLVAATAILLGASRLVKVISADPTMFAPGQQNPYLLISDEAFISAYAPVPYLIDVVILVAFVVIVIARWHQASAPARRVFTPVALPTLVILVLILVETVVTSFTTAPADVKRSLGDAAVIGRAMFPLGFLVGLMRMRMARSAVADLVVDLGQAPTPARLRDALANALGDPSLAVAYWSPTADRFLDTAGETVELPGDGSGRAVTLLEREGVPLAAIIHDAALLDDPGLIPSVASALRLAVENERLQGEVEIQLGEVRASRARIVAAGDAERKRVERDLHDGAQQRLVSLSLALRLARTRLGDDLDPAVRASLDQASAEAKAALLELRELARGIHPQILTEAGLGPAVESLAARSPVDVSVEIDGQRFSAAVEGAAYFVVSEALANVAKYAQASHALVRADTLDGRLTIEISDDGIGGADAASGSGLRGLGDRLSAIDGTLEIFSPRGGGTRLLARIPLVDPVPMPG